MGVQKAMFDLSAYLKTRRDLLNDALESYFRYNSNSTRLIQAMTHSLMAGGKRLRPILCIAASEATGGKVDDVLPLGCAG